MTDLRTGPDGLARCGWVGDDPEYRRYHDEEWGRPLHGDRALFEKMSLEGFQAGLSWITILRKRPRFREVFAGFEPEAVAAFGGGVVGDLSGFVAASYMRGVDFYQIPTTLLAAVDSSVGGKTGVNIPEGKNLVGAFHQPKAVYTDSAFLKSLPKRQFAAGMAEVVKCAVLGDAELFGRLAARGKPMEFDSPELGDAVVSSCKLKAKIVAEDERETSPNGGRALLNLGHTFGHAIERNAGYGKYLHGEAVSIGTVMAAVLSRRLGLIGDAQVDAIARLLQSENLPVSLAERISADDFIDAMHGDKKALAGALRFVTILDIGKTRTETVPDALVRDAIADFYKR